MLRGPPKKIDLSLRENAWDKDFAYRTGSFKNERLPKGARHYFHSIPGPGAGRRGPRAPPHLRFD